MAFTPLNFAFGSKLTSTLLNQYQGNFTALAQGQSGGPRFGGLARAFATFYGNAQAFLIVSEGVSSVTYSGKTVTINWTTPFGRDDYCVNFNSTRNVGPRLSSVMNFNQTASSTTLYRREVEPGNTFDVEIVQGTIVAWEA